MTFTIICNNCKSKVELKQDDRNDSELIKVGTSEPFDVVGSSVDSINIYCCNCNNEVDL